MTIVNDYYFITIDAETTVIPEGIQVISGIRDEVEKQEKVRIPLVWFVEFQRTWTDSVKNDSVDYFRGPLRKAFDGFELGKNQFLQFLDRGDEVAWHYHANNYVDRDDLSHARRLEILEADLVSCACEIKARHPYFEVRSFRFGWLFVPDYKIFDTLKKVGIRADASVDPKRNGRNVSRFTSRYLPPITEVPRNVDGIYFFPYSRTLLIHDWNVVPHELGWSSLDTPGALRNQEKFREDLLMIAADLRNAGGAFLTYQTFLYEQLPSS